MRLLIDRARGVVASRPMQTDREHGSILHVGSVYVFCAHGRSVELNDNSTAMAFDLQPLLKKAIPV